MILTEVLASQFELAPAPADAVSAVRFAPGLSSRLLASCWDTNVYLYEIQGDGDEAEGTLIRQYPNRSTVLDVCFGKDENEAFSAGLDHTVQR